MNVADSNEMGRHLKANGLVETQDPEEASVMLVNTCTVRQHAEDRAFSEIGRLRIAFAAGYGESVGLRRFSRRRDHAAARPRRWRINLYSVAMPLRT